MTTDRIPLTHSVVYAVRGVPEVPDEYNAERTIAPHEITLTYRTTEDSQLGRVHAYVKGWWMQDGARVPMDKPVGRHFWGRNFADWPEWLVEEARLHDPDAAVEPPADRTALRDRIIEALLAPRYGGPQHNTPGGLRLTATPEEARRHRAGQIADIVLPLLLPPVSRADVLRDAADALPEADLPFVPPMDRRRVADWLRRLAEEAQPAQADRTVAYRSPGTRTLYCVICARQETGWKSVAAAEVQDGTVCDFCGGRVLAVASRTLGEVVARYTAADEAQPGTDAQKGHGK